MAEDDDISALEADSAAKKKKRPKKKKKAKQDDDDGKDPELDDPQDLGLGNAGGHQGLGRQEEDFDIETADWTDITAECQMAIEGMDVGEMIESPGFRLLDAMSAIEIMDPKMDSGFNNSADMTLDRAVEVGVIAPKLTHEELVSIWDQLLMYYLLWLEGHTIVQTFFCCLYLQDLEKYVKPIPYFSTFADAFLIACRQARSIVLRAGVFDDEDFLPSLFGVDLDACVKSNQPNDVWKQVQKDCKSLSKDSAPHAKSLASRLEFIGKYMLALTEFEGSLPKSNLDNAKDGLTVCLGLLERMGESTQALSAEILKCFDPSINRRLLVPGPPRTVEPIHDSQAVLGMWNSHVQELLLCGSLAGKPLVQLLDGAITYKGEPNVLPRSAAQLRVSEGGLLRGLLLDSLELYLFPRDAVQHCKKATEEFLDHSESLFAHLLKLTHANRARRFRRLAHVFGEFNVLQHEAWQLDADLKKTFGANMKYPRPCWVWVMEHCLQMMLAKLFLGFELELYDQAEYHMIYWYADYLYGLRVYNLNEMHHANEQMLGEKKKRPPPRAAQQGKAGIKPSKPPAALIFLEATQSTVRGLFRLLAFCLREDLVKVPGPVRDGLAQRFVLRFRSLEHFKLPHLPSFEDFQRSSASAQAPVESHVVLDAAQASFGEAQAALERLAASKDKGAEQAMEAGRALKRVVVGNQVSITRLLQALAAGKKLPIKVETSHHPYLVSVQVLTEAAKISPEAAEAKA